MKNKLKWLAALGTTAIASSAQAENTVLTAEQIASLTDGLDMAVVVPVVLAVGGAIIAFTMFKGSIMGAISMISTAVRR